MCLIEFFCNIFLFLPLSVLKNILPGVTFCPLNRYIGRTFLEKHWIMKVKFLKLNNLVVVGLMSLLGLSACKKEPDIVPLYGVIAPKYCEKAVLDADMPALVDAENPKNDENQISET